MCFAFEQNTLTWPGLESNLSTLSPMHWLLDHYDYDCPSSWTAHRKLHYHYISTMKLLYKFFFSFVTVTLDDFCPSLVIQVMPNSTPAEILIVTVGKRNGIFQVSLGNGEGESNVWCKTSEPFQIRHLSRQENEWKKISKRKQQQQQQQQKQKKKGKIFSNITHCTSLSRWNF